MQEIEKHNFDEDWIKSLKEYHKDNYLILNELKTIDHTQIVQLLNAFIYNTGREKYFCMVFEIMGINLLELIKKYNYKGIPLPYVRIIAKQILIGLDFLHRICNYIHTDLNPENILICLNKDELETIQETGHFDVQESINKNEINDISNSASNSYSFNENNDSNNKISLNEIRVKRQKQRQIQKLKKLGKKSEKKNNNDDMDDTDNNLNLLDEDNNDMNKYELEDLIERPRAASLPKLNLSNDYDKIENIYDFDLVEYSNDIQNYIKERKRLIKDKNYKKRLIKKNKLLSEAQTEKEKNEILLKLNKQYNSNWKGIDQDINTKIYKFGKACSFNNHINKLIQTRQYRAPEVILGINYNETADIWSLACIIFELATGEYLFDVKGGTGFSKNDDHLSKILKILGKMPKEFVSRGAHTNKYFDKFGKLKRIKDIKYLNLKDLLIKKYKFKEDEAKALSDFLLPMLEYYPEKRATARKMLKHPWLNMTPNFNYLMKEDEIKNNEKIDDNDLMTNGNDNEKDIYSSDNEICKADDEDNDKDEKYKEKKNEEDDNGDENPDKIIIPNYNNSFAEYGQFIDLTNLDRANPQFDEIMKDENEE